MKYTALTRRAPIAGALATAAAEQSPEILRLPCKVQLGMIGIDGHAGEILGQLSHVPEVELPPGLSTGLLPKEDLHETIDSSIDLRII